MTRGRKPLVVPSRSLHIHLDSNLADQIDSGLYSEAEQRVPKGEYQRFFTEAAVFRLRLQSFDLSPYSSGLPGEHMIYLFPSTREVLQALLERRRNANKSGIPE